MSRTIRAIIGVLLILVVTFTAISICQHIGKGFKVDITERNLYTLSDGTKSILGKLRQPIKAKLYYAKTAALEGPDQIRYFNSYYQYVNSLLEEYAAEAKGMFDLEVIDPRPFSDEEVQATRYGLRRFPITEEENFFFGLVIQTQFGVEKVIPFFSPDRQKFVEYDISYLIDTAITRQKRRIGVLSSISVMGDDVTGYMAQMMRMQGQTPSPPWTFVEQLRRQYEVKSVPADVNEISEIGILLVIHPKKLPEQTLFAIDQFVLKGGRTVVCVDPHCFMDQPDRRQMQMGMPPSSSSELNKLLRTWGLEMPANTFAGDRDLALRSSLTPDKRPETIIGFLGLTPACFNDENVITAELNQVRMLFSGVLKEVGAADANEPQIERTPLVTTTARGNSFSISSPYEMMMLNPRALMDKFIEGTKPVSMAYRVTGRFKSSFPNGIEIEVDEGEPKDPNDVKKVKKLITGIKQAEEDCAVVVVADVDFISDILAYQNAFFGKIVVGDNSSLMLNTIEDLSGSSDLVSIRSRGNFRRPFVVVDEIEKQAEADTAQEVAKINLNIAVFNQELENILSNVKKGEEELIGGEIVKKKRELEVNILNAEREKRRVNMKSYELIDGLGKKLQNINMLTAPTVILLIAVVLWLLRSVRKRYYISHASDA